MRRIDPSQFPPELKLAIACARWPLSEQDKRNIGRHVVPGLDWKCFFSWLLRHGITSLVHRNLRELNTPAVPVSLLSELRDQHTRSARQALTHIAEMARVVRILENSEIEPLVVKGPTLSLLAFGDATLRTSRDIDLLIGFESVEKADRLITRAGYRRVAPDFALSPQQWRSFQRLRCQFAYYNDRIGVALELHWRLTSNALLLPFEHATLRTSARVVRLGGTNFRTLSDQDLFLYLCTHGSLHVWFRLKWLMDIGALVRRMTPDEITAASTRARSIGIGRSFDQAILLAHDLLAASIPSAVLIRASRDSSAKRQTATALRAINWHGHPGEPADTRWFNLWISWQAYPLKPGLIYRLAEFRNQLASPEDWHRMPLPEWLSFLYLPLRPLSWGIRKLKQGLSRPPTV